jgi:hypothetical protein
VSDDGAKLSEAILPGHGGSDYERHLIHKRFFPDLWALRNKLTALSQSTR